MDKNLIYILLEIEAKNYLLVEGLERIGFKVDDPIYCMLETKHGSINDILTEYFETDFVYVHEFITDYIKSFGDDIKLDYLDGKEMYEEALKYFEIAE